MDTHPIRHLLRARDLVDARFAEALTVDHLARAAGLSRAHFSREFRRAFGESPHQYLLTRRLERAAALLRTTDLAVVDVCHAVGWRSLGSFGVSFGRMYDTTPSAYRAANATADAPHHVPRCVVLAHSRRENRTFREGARSRRP